MVLSANRRNLSNRDQTVSLRSRVTMKTCHINKNRDANSVDYLCLVQVYLNLTPNGAAATTASANRLQWRVGQGLCFLMGMLEETLA